MTVSPLVKCAHLRDQIDQEGSKNVMVLAQKFKLTQPQSTLLNRGLSFVPSRGSQRNMVEQSRWDLQQNNRRIKLNVYCQNKKVRPLIPFTHKSEWSPPLSRLPPEVTDLIKADFNYFENYFHPSKTRAKHSVYIRYRQFVYKYWYRRRHSSFKKYFY